ncbi:MAG: DNRLRE domain-containing protein [Planctomycetota bacterium]|jgi:hypothetical protein
MKRTVICGLSAIAGLGVSLPLQADSVTLGPVKDNTLFSTTTTSNGAGDGVFSGRTGVGGGGTIQRAVLAFDVAGNIPAGSTITSVTLTLTLLQSGPAGPQNHDLHRVLNDWGEGTSVGFGGNGAPATPGDATWLHTFFPDQFWTIPGGDFDLTPSASQFVDAPVMAYTWGPTPGLVADAQDMLDNPGSDFGWMLRGNEDSFFTARKFASREYPEPTLRPQLTLEFEPPCFQVISEEVVCHGGGDTFTYSVQGTDACTGGMSSYSFTASGGAVGEELCFTVLINAEGGGYCCPAELCVTIPDCLGAMPGDLDGDGGVGVVDVLIMLDSWGACTDCGSCPADLDGDCAVGITDMLGLLANWS